jgi:hypothetical protein
MTQSKLMNWLNVALVCLRILEIAVTLGLHLSALH